MSLKIRLRQHGRTNRPFYRIVVTDSRTRRDGKYVENIGWYNPFAKESVDSVEMKVDRLQYWLDNGVELSETVELLATKVAPEIVKANKKKFLDRRAKLCAKRRERRRKKAAAVAA